MYLWLGAQHFREERVGHDVDDGVANGDEDRAQDELEEAHPGYLPTPPELPGTALGIRRRVGGVASVCCRRCDRCFC